MYCKLVLRPATNKEIILFMLLYFADNKYVIGAVETEFFWRKTKEPTAIKTKFNSEE